MTSVAASIKSPVARILEHFYVRVDVFCKQSSHITGDRSETKQPSAVLTTLTVKRRLLTALVVIIATTAVISAFHSLVGRIFPHSGLASLSSRFLT